MFTLSPVILFSRITGILGGARKMGAGMRTSIVSVDVLRGGDTGRLDVEGWGLYFGLLDLEWVREEERWERWDFGVRLGVVNGSAWWPALIAGGGGLMCELGVEFESSIVPRLVGGALLAPNPPNPNFGVRSHMLLIFGVMPPPPFPLSFFTTMPVVEFGEGWPRVDRES